MASGGGFRDTTELCVDFLRVVEPGDILGDRCFKIEALQFLAYSKAAKFVLAVVEFSAATCVLVQVEGLVLVDFFALTLD